MWRQKPGVEAFDLAILLELPVVLDGLVEDLDRLALTAPHDLTPPMSSTSFAISPSFGLV